uniref:Uncharacterized protein n=1 Tax=Triticum urartu TaxID=4572 RepID=A0A8R7UC15_TRIUA
TRSKRTRRLRPSWRGGCGRSGTRSRPGGARSGGGARARPSRSRGGCAPGGVGALWRRPDAGVAPLPRRRGACARAARRRRRGRSGSSGGTAAAAPPAAPTAPCIPRTTTPSSPAPLPARTWALAGSWLAGCLTMLGSLWVS